MNQGAVDLTEVLVDAVGCGVIDWHVVPQGLVDEVLFSKVPNAYQNASSIQHHVERIDLPALQVRDCKSAEKVSEDKQRQNGEEKFEGQERHSSPHNMSRPSLIR